MSEIKEKQEELIDVEKKKEQADEILKDKKKEAGKRSRELAELEQNIRVVVSKQLLFNVGKVFFFYFVFSTSKIRRENILVTFL